VKTVTLTLRSRDDGAEKIAELVWENGNARVVGSVETIADDLHRLIEVGLVEWIGEPGARQRRHTPSVDASFLERLGDYFARQSGFAIKLVERHVDLKIVRASTPLVRGAVYIVRRAHHLDAIFATMQRPNQLQANPMLLSQLGPSGSQRRAIYHRGLFQSFKANSHERN
jgi:hypothetical protein